MNSDWPEGDARPNRAVTLLDNLGLARDRAACAVMDASWRPGQARPGRGRRPRALGIPDVGKVGTVLARLALAAGTGCSSPVRATRRGLSHRRGAHARRGRHHRGRRRRLVLALPLPQNHRRGVARQARGRRDELLVGGGIRDDFTDPRTSSTGTVQAFLPDSRVVSRMGDRGPLCPIIWWAGSGQRWN